MLGLDFWNECKLLGQSKNICGTFQVREDGHLAHLFSAARIPLPKRPFRIMVLPQNVLDPVHHLQHHLLNLASIDQSEDPRRPPNHRAGPAHNNEHPADLPDVQNQSPQHRAASLRSQSDSRVAHFY